MLTVVFRFNPRQDGELQVFTYLPALCVEHVLLQDRKERLHRGVVTGRTHSIHRAHESVDLEGAHERPKAE